VGGGLKNSKKKPTQAGWPRHLALVRATPRAEADVSELNCAHAPAPGNLSINSTFVISSLSPPEIR